MKIQDFILLFILVSCNLSNPRIKNQINTPETGIRSLGPLTLQDLYKELESLDDNDTLDSSAHAEGEVVFAKPQFLTFKSGAIQCRFRYTAAKFKKMVVGPLALGLDIRTEILPENALNITNGTENGRTLCATELQAQLPQVIRSTMVPSLERKLSIETLKEFLSDIEHSCSSQATLAGTTLKCQGLEYEISKIDYFSVGGALSAYQIKLEIETTTSTRSWNLIYSPKANAILAHGLLSLTGDAPFLHLYAGSLGEIRTLELANLQ